MRKCLAAVLLLVLSSCNEVDRDSPSDGRRVKNPPVEINPTPQSGTGGEMPAATDDKTGQGKTQ